MRCFRAAAAVSAVSVMRAPLIYHCAVRLSTGRNESTGQIVLKWQDGSLQAGSAVSAPVRSAQVAQMRSGRYKVGYKVRALPIAARVSGLRPASNDRDEASCRSVVCELALRALGAERVQLADAVGVEASLSLSRGP
jgi:hypothetical protein